MNSTLPEVRVTYLNTILIHKSPYNKFVGDGVLMPLQIICRNFLRASELDSCFPFHDILPKSTLSATEHLKPIHTDQWKHYPPKIMNAIAKREPAGIAKYKFLQASLQTNACKMCRITNLERPMVSPKT